MAKKYGMLPTEVLSRATTMDIQIHSHSETYQQRAQAAANGGDVGETMSPTEIDEVYKAWRGNS